MKKLIITLLLSMITSTTFAAISLPKATPDMMKRGEKVYKESCAVCHKNGVAQAPKAHDIAAWKIRFNNALSSVKDKNPKATPEELQQKAMDILISSVKNGIGAMPPGGMCAQCKDSSYEASILYMMSKK